MLHPGRAAVPKVIPPVCKSLHCFASFQVQIILCLHLTGNPVFLQTEIREKLASMYGVDTLECISVFGFRTQVCLVWIQGLDSEQPMGAVWGQESCM